MNWSELLRPEYLELLPRENILWLFTGMAIGLFTRWAARYLAIAAVAYLVFLAFVEAGIV